MVSLSLQVAQAEAHSEPGERARVVCASCHGLNGQSVSPDIPNLAGQSATYLTGQLLAFKSEQRKNPVMGPLAMPLSEEDMRAVASYYESQPRVVGTADPKSFPRGEQVYRGGNQGAGVPACMSCHAPNGAGNPAAGFPALGGQNAGYVAKQLKAYRSGGRGGERAEVMKAIAQRMADEDVDAVAGYLQGLH